MAPPSPRAALENLTLADADALDCGVCFLPLKPPIFQVRRYVLARTMDISCVAKYLL